MDKAQEIGLKPCPFCGDKCWINKDQYKPGIGYLYCVHCPTCHYSFNSHDFKSETEAIKAWNTRISPIPVPSVDKELLNAMQRIKNFKGNMDCEKVYEIIDEAIAKAEKEGQG